MGTGTLTDRASGQAILDDFFNSIHAALNGDLTGRNSSGIATSGQNLGTIAVPWGTLNVDNINIGGSALDTSAITSVANRVISGAERADSNFSDFLRANGAALELNVNGATTTLAVSINGVAVNVTTDITKTGLTAAPSSNNTAVLSLTGSYQDNTLYMPEDGMDVTIGTVGSEISSLVGKTAAFKTSNNEYFKCKIKDATTLSDGFRGYFFDSAGAPVVRAALVDASTITLMKLGWIFIENNGTTVDVTYTEPVRSFAAPSSPASGDYWLDTNNKVWKRYNGSSWEIINRTYIGEFITDSTNCVATRPVEFSKDFKSDSDLRLAIDTTSILKVDGDQYSINVNGQKLESDLGGISWNITTDLDTGSEAADKLYFAYLADTGEQLLSLEKPYFRAEMKGWYHPHHTWRCVGAGFNDSGSDVVSVADYVGETVVSAASESGAFSTSSTTHSIVTNQEFVFIHLDKRKDLIISLSSRGGDMSYTDAAGLTAGELSLFEDGVGAGTLMGLNAQVTGIGFVTGTGSFKKFLDVSDYNKVNLHTTFSLRGKSGNAGVGFLALTSVRLKIETEKNTRL